MSRISPTLEGFRAALHRPSLTLAEISWRWTAGGAAAALFIFSLLEYLDTLPVTRGDILLLRTRQPVLIGQALGHIFRGSLPRIVIAEMLGAMSLTVLWIFAASVGRATTVRSLTDYFAERLKSTNGDCAFEREAEESLPFAKVISVPGKSSESFRRSLGPLVRLNFLRAATVPAALLGLVGAMILVRMVSAAFSSGTAATGVPIDGAGPPNPNAGVVFLLFLPLAALIFLAWLLLNWMLSLAGMLAVRGSENASHGAGGALSEAVALCRDRAGAVLAVSTWTGLAHLTAFIVATTVVSMSLSFAPIVPGKIVLAGIILVTAVYFAVADWLYIARLAGYVCIAAMPEARLAPLPAALPPGPPSDARATPGPSAQTAIDRDEPILSDLPNLAVET